MTWVTNANEKDVTEQQLELIEVEFTLEKGIFGGGIIINTDIDFNTLNFFIISSARA